MNFCHAGISIQVDAQRATFARLCERHFHGLQLSPGIYRKGHRDIEGHGSVNAGSPWAVLLGIEVARPVPAGTTAKSATFARVVLGGMQSGVPSALVRLHDVDLCTRHTANLVCITIVVVARGNVGILLHGDQV